MISESPSRDRTEQIVAAFTLLIAAAEDAAAYLESDHADRYPRKARSKLYARNIRAAIQRVMSL